MAWEDVDYCLRVFASGRECIYEPAACATHGESQYRADAADTKETPDAWRLLKVKYDALNLSAFTPVYE
jgi:GT2 family glycosyltransferase